MNKALFLDRDGVLNVDKGYVYKWEDLVWVEEIFEIIKIANERAYKVIVLTNQSGIHHGMYKREDVDLLHGQMEKFLVNKGLRIDDWFYCAELDSIDRKPLPGMLLAAQKKYDVDLSKSFMVGDKPTDVFETDGKFVRPVTFLVKGAYELNHPDIGNGVKVFENHAEVLKEIKNRL